MGLTDWLRGSDPDGDPEGDDDEDAPEMWSVICRDEKNQAASRPDQIDGDEWNYRGEPLDKTQFTYQYGEHLEPGIEYICVEMETGTGHGSPNFDNIRWTHEEPVKYERDQTDEIRETIRQELDGGVMGNPDDPFEDRLLQAVITGQVDLGTAEQVVDLKSQLSAAKNPANRDYFEDADLSNPGQVATAGLMNMLQSYDSVGDAVEDVVGGAVSAGPAASVPTQQPSTPQPPAAPQDRPADAGTGADPDPDDPPVADEGTGQSSAAAKHADRMADVVDESTVSASPEVAEAAADAGDVGREDTGETTGDAPADAGRDDDDRGWTAEDVPDGPDELDEQLAEDFPGDTGDEPADDAETAAETPDDDAEETEVEA